MNKILKIQNLTKNFGNVSAVSNVSIEVEEGTIHSIIGPNGAGKSTFFNMISGVILHLKEVFIIKTKTSLVLKVINYHIWELQNVFK